MNDKDYYEILGVSKEATDNEIKTSFRTLVKKYHPDVSKEPDAVEKFKIIHEAYEVLSDKEKRIQYDIYQFFANEVIGENESNFNSCNKENDEKDADEDEEDEYTYNENNSYDLITRIMISIFFGSFISAVIIPFIGDESSGIVLVTVIIVVFLLISMKLNNDN